MSLSLTRGIAVQQRLPAGCTAFLAQQCCCCAASPLCDCCAQLLRHAPLLCAAGQPKLCVISLREQIGGRPPYPGRAFARRQISRSLMLLRDRTGSKRRADLCRANRRAAAAFRSLVLQRDTEDVLPRRLLRNARRNDEAKIDIDRPSPTESTRLPCTGKIPPRRHASAGCIPASAETCKVRYLTRRFVVSSTKRSSSASRVSMFW